MAYGSHIVHRLARAIAHVFYRVDVVGNVPPAGPVILLPNHPNALLDPALVMATAGREVRFLAKSTLFKTAFAPLLKAARAIPVYRRQDGVDPSQNEGTFSAVQAALGRGEAICVFPEGVSHSSGRLEPLRSGAARMALAAAATGIDPQLVAVGINLERKTIFRSRAMVAYGAPFGPKDDARALTSEIATHMRALLVEADPRGDAELVDRIERLYSAERPQSEDPHTALLRRKAIADAMHRLRAERPEWYESALIELRRYDERLKRFGLRDTALDWEVDTATAWPFLAREVPAALLLAPVAAAAVAVFTVPYGLTAAASRLSSDMDVTATAKVLGGFIIYAAWIAVLAGTAGWQGGPLAGIIVLAGLPVLAGAGLFAIERESAAWLTARSWLALRGADRTTRQALKRRRAELAGVLDEVSTWMQR